MKIRVSNVGYALLQGRIYRPHYLDPQNGIIHSSICLDRDTLKFCNAADLNPKTGTVRNATFINRVNDSIGTCKAVFGVNTLKAYEDAGYVKIDIPFCSQAYLCQTFLRRRFPDKQQLEEVCKQYGIDDSYDFKFIYSDDEYDEAMEKRDDAYVAAARECFSIIPLADENSYSDMLYFNFEKYFCMAYSIRWCIENGHMPSDETLYALG